MNYILNLPGLLIAIVFHELAHGYTAYKLGDDTAKNAGRLTLNPIKHMDPVGFLCMLIFRFGWAKPVPINPFKFKNRKKGTILVSIAGPLTNFIIASIVVLILNYVPIKSQIVFQMVIMTLWYNVMLGVFNLIPLPPLDGSKIVASLLPVKMEYYFYKYERYLYLGLILLIASNSVNMILGPAVSFVLDLIVRILS